MSLRDAGSRRRERASREHRRRDRLPLDDGDAAAAADEQARAIVEGAVLGGYEPGAWKTVTREGEEVSELVLVTDADVSDDVRRAETAPSWANRARDLVNRPGERPHARELCRVREPSSPTGASGLSAESLGPDEMRALGMGALLAVGAGSYNEPRLIVLRWEPPSPTRKDVLLGLVGKGMTFDSGGISLKPATNMEAMKGDMAGAAAVVAGIGALAELEIPVRAIAVVAAAENMPSGRSMRPGDILTAANGKTIEITNTDAEGRLVLADALWYAREQGATNVVDFATLTGAMSARPRRPVRRRIRERRRLARRDRGRRRGERRLRLAVPAPSALPPAHRFGVRRHEELGPAPPGRARLRDVIPRRVRGRRAVGPHRHGRPGAAHVVPRRLPLAGRRHRLGRPPDRIARRAPGERVNFELAEEHELIRRTVREFAEQRVAPVAEELDREHRFPYELVEELAELGLMGIPIPEQWGGAGGDTLSYAIAIEELARIDSSVCITVAAHTSLGTMPILLFGTEEQKQRWLPDLASGRKLAAFGLTEPGAGSDAGATQTRAELRDGEWVIDGSKIFITNAGTDITSCVTITALTGEGEVSNIIVPNGTPGYVISEPMEKMGWRASDTRELSFQGCAVPEANLLGPRGQGFHQFLEILDGGRISVAAMAVGLAQGAFDLAVAYAKEREQFGRPIADFQAVQFKLADMAVEIDAGRLLTYKAAWLKDQGRPFGQEAAIAKLYTGEVSNRVVNHALQIHGGYGFMDEFAISRLYRDQKILEIGEGTNEVQRMVIAKHLGLKNS